MAVKWPVYRHVEHAWKYELLEDYRIRIPAALEPFAHIVDTPFIRLSPLALTIKQFYAWDGPSGPTIDTKDGMRGALVHDACYQLMRTGKMSTEAKGAVDAWFRTICREDGMSLVRAWYWYWGVRVFGGHAIDDKESTA